MARALAPSIRVSELLDRGFLIEPLPSITNAKSTVFAQGAKGGGAGGEGEGAGNRASTVAGRSSGTRIVSSFIVSATVDECLFLRTKVAHLGDA